MPAAIATADRALSAFKRMGARAGDGPTPERLVQARGGAHVEVAISAGGRIDETGQARAAVVKEHRIRATTAPLDQMAKGRRLDADPMRAAAMLSAGRRYHALWYKAGLSPLKGQDPAAIRTTAVGAGFVGTAAKQEAFDDYRLASDALDRAERAAVDGIVLHELALVDVGRKVDRMITDRASSIAIASHELRAGLQRLAVHFGLLSAETRVMDSDPGPLGLPPEMAALLDAMDAREARGA